MQDDLTLTPIYVAIKDNNTQQLTSLINSGVNLEETHPEYSSPLHYAISIGATTAVNILLDAGCCKEAPDLQGSTPLHNAIYKNNLPVVKTLLDRGVDKECWNPWGSTPLHHAIYYGYRDIAKALLDSGADPKREDKDGNIPLQHAIFRSCQIESEPASLNLEQISLDLIEAGADISSPIIQSEIGHKSKYALMLKLLEVKPKTLNIDAVYHLVGHDDNKDVFDPIKSHCIVLYLFKYAIELEGRQVRKRIMDQLINPIYSNAEECKILQDKIEKMKGYNDPSFYSLFKSKDYEMSKKSKLFAKFEDFKNMKVSRDILVDYSPTNKVYEHLARPLLAALELIDNITSPLDYLQTRVTTKEGFESIPHAPKILEFLASKDMIKLASVSKNPFALFFSIKTSNPQPLEHHVEQVENPSTITGEYDANESG